MHWLELMLVISGTLLTAVLYALLTDLVRRARFDKHAQRPNPPTRDHVIVAGLGQTGIRIAKLLEQLKRKVVGVDTNNVEPHVLPSLPVVAGNPAAERVLLEAHLLTARGLVAATSDDQHNIEIALHASTLNPECRIAVRTFDPRFRENVINLFQTPHSPVMVVEYEVTAGDTLVNHPLWEIAEGYAVVPVLHQRSGSRGRSPGPDDASLILTEGDRLIVLATAASLPQIVPLGLYPLHAARTARLLNANGVETRVVERDSLPELEKLRESAQDSESEV